MAAASTPESPWPVRVVAGKIGEWIARLGEVWVDSPALSGGFWGLKKHTQSIFRARPLLFTVSQPGYSEPLEQEFLRTGLLGCLVEGELVVFGFYEDQVHQIVEIDQPDDEQQQDASADNMPEGDVMELHDTAQYQLQIVDGDKTIHDERVVVRYVVLMTPGADRWVIRQLQAVPQF